MSDDIVNRLRMEGKFWQGPHNKDYDVSPLQHHAADEIERLRAQVAKLREALAPFAAEAEYAKPDDSDDDEVYDSFFTVGQFRRARAAIAETER